MKQIAIGCAAVLVLGGIAIAQNAAPADAPQISPGAVAAPAMPDVEGDSATDMGRRMMDEMRWRHHHRRDGRAARQGNDGAAFAWRAADGSRFMFRCAEHDTTQECVDAILPLIERVAPGAEPAQ